jgi:hypothetical protein
MRLTLLRFCFAFLFIIAVQASAQQIAFPGAEGAGKYTSGGRGTATNMTTVFEVTNLTDVNSVGSLRYACSQSTSTYPYRTIVFRVSGTIHLNSRLNIPANTTIAGQTAPGDGICIADYPVVINGNNVIVRYIRCRMGDKNQLKTSPASCGVPIAPFTSACMPLDGSGGDDALGNLGNKNLIIDHCSVSWSTDEALTVYRGDSVTLQWNLIAEPLNYSYHFETGDTDFEHHGYGGIWGGIHASFHHNLFAHCRNRNPRFAGNSTYASGVIETADFRNNVLYNWGINTVYGGEGGNYNLVNNYYKYGPVTSSGVRYRIVGVDSNATNGYAKYFLSGNYVDGSTTNTANNWTGASMMSGKAADTVKSKVTSPFLSGYLPTTTDDAIVAYDTVLKNVGCVLPVRDTLDQRIINDVKNRAGAHIDVQGGFPHATPYTQTVNAWPYLATATPPTDTDHDGMPDDWETANNLNPNSAVDRGVFASNGYTNLENYLNKITSTQITTPPPTTTVPTAPASAIWTLLTDQTASVIGNVIAANQSLGSSMVGVQYGSAFGTVAGWQRTGSTSYLPTAYDANVYNEYKISPSNGKYFTANSVQLNVLGGGTSTARMAVYYSLDNFVTSAPVGTCTYNGSTYDATVAGTPVVLLNTSTTPLTGQQVATIPTYISVSPGQTLSVRMYAWITGSGNRYFTSQNVTIEGVTSDVVLPLTLNQFSATLQNDKALLQWQTSNEVNMRGFTIESSIDASNFTAIATISANNQTTNSYHWLDATTRNGTVYYRLKMMNTDGSFTYSNIVSVVFKAASTLAIYPNPVVNTLLLKYGVTSTTAQASLYSVQGKKIMTVTIPSNTTQTSIDASKLPSGWYLLQMADYAGIKTVKFLKQ